MRKITILPVFVFSFLAGSSGVLAWVLLSSFSQRLPPIHNDILLFFIFILFFYMFNIFFFRILLFFRPISNGEIKPGSKEEFCYNIYLLYRIILFFPLMRTKLIPVPLTRPLYILLGAKLGSNTYSGGTILDPPLTEIGANTIIGEDALIFSHVIEGAFLSHEKVIIGSNVTIGAKSIIMPGSIIRDGAIIAAGSIVPKKTEILDDEIWAGVPAKHIKQSN